MGGYNVLINNAGIGSSAPLLSVTAGDMRRVWETNVLGATLVARESARYFVPRNAGAIVNVASTSGQRAGADKQGIRLDQVRAQRIDRSVAHGRLRKSDIRVMQVNPSEVMTPFFESNGYGARPGQIRGSCSPRTSRMSSSGCWSWTTARS